MVGPEAGEVMAVVQMAMVAGLPFTVLRDAVLTHPILWTAADIWKFGSR